MLRKTVLAMSVIGVAAVLGAALLLWSEWPGGIRPSYEAGDDDPRLTAVAAGALPLIAALERYFAAHNAYPAAGDGAALATLAAELGNPNAAHRSSAGVELDGGWSYSRGADISSYRLSKKLGWDTALEFCRDATSSQWVFLPGDGSDDVAIVLHPRPVTASH